MSEVPLYMYSIEDKGTSLSETACAVRAAAAADTDSVTLMGKHSFPGTT
jgi:hypothetical protein